jgi:hypothetical protein
MNRRNWLRALATTGAAIVISNPRDLFAAAAPRMVIYKTPSCGCCAKWVDHIKAAGFTPVIKDLDDVSGIKKNQGVPETLWSCHTALVEGYAIEGHVPADLIKRLIAERPKLVGLAVPGMPQGSPGMETGRKDSYDVVAWEKGGKMRVYARR